MRFLLTAEEFGAGEARRIGLVQEVVPAGRRVDRAVEIAHVGTCAGSCRASSPARTPPEGARSFAERREGRSTGR